MQGKKGHTHSASSSSHSLPPRFTVPPMPPTIHRKLSLVVRDDCLLIVPRKDVHGDAGSIGDSDNDERGVKISWGLKGKVESWEGRVQIHDDEAIELGGILGLVRLWDAAYLLVFLPSLRPPFPLFRDHVNPKVGEDTDERRREAGPSSHLVHCLADVHPIPLTHDLAVNAMDRLKSIQLKRRAKPAKWPFLSGLNIKAPAPTEGPEEPASEASDDSDDDGESNFAGGSALSSQPSRDSSVAPEADESPLKLPATQDDMKKRFSMGWGKFTSQLGAVRATGNQPKNGELDGLLRDSHIVDPEATPRAPEWPEPESKMSEESARAHPPPMDPPQRRQLETKILRQIIREFTSGAFFYSFDFDLTHTMQHKRRRLATRKASSTALQTLLPKSPELATESSGTFPPTASEILGKAANASETFVIEDDFVEPDVQVPLWRRVDRRFFWNEFLLHEFIEAGLHSFILPISQGWIQSSSFNIPISGNVSDPSGGVVPVDLVVISRRSRDRAGLRFQRRGIDDDGHVANMVETEMIVRAKVEGKASLFSFVQVRGSIPLKWSQSPYSMKPPPVLDQPVDQSFSVANVHFDDFESRYGPITIVNLGEQSGKEGAVTNGYGQLVDNLARKDLTYHAFDFHAKCHGMKWENISELVEMLDFGEMGYLWSLSGESIREQNGAFRTNCIDCLDRTNVVQSAVARHVLSTMLTQLGLIPDSSTSNIEGVFNDIWANNGDMLSLCYAHTSALKGDFVRTGKRDVQGMLHDGISSISRMFYGAVSDFFDQAVISFLLGHRNLGVFNEFLENLESSDASTLIKLSRVRAAAIETSSARVLEEDEQRIAGWTMLSPEDRNVRLTLKLEEKVLLLTKINLYVVSFNYSLEKVVGFSRIPLKSITSIQKGAYILSPLQEAGRDVSENAGFIVSFSPVHEDTRYSTYSLRNRAGHGIGSPTTSPEVNELETRQRDDLDPHTTEFFAFKILPREFAVRPTSIEDSETDDEGGANETCRQAADRIVKRISDQCRRVNPLDKFVIDKDVVSLTEAQKSTSLLQRVDYAFKRFLWL
ncbi:SacI homology domain-domain-containing protein [Kockovaella imperatae]|uniref:SacI homology domain-domain-containing protein n=1 Tax=Kockovaella imperatae TaxID=4999 RepID=A0A1Y1USA4_9TREE|nr:SacI homology domain-domain-containing protein [Kockovaella imperatae]ORX40908.1 SacI homology domain-domain-containing protein [Kockovaella imperatae]